MLHGTLNRRYFVSGLASATIAWPLGARAQGPAMPVIGLLSGNRLDDVEVGAVQRGLNEAGYAEGRNVAVERRSADGQYGQLPALAADLVRGHVTVIIAIGGTASALAAKAATHTIPIVFATAGDPVELRLVSSLDRPGGNVTGVSFLGAGLGAKRLEVMHDLMPTATRVGFLLNPRNPNSGSESSDVQAAARTLGQQIHVEKANDEHEIDAAFANFSLQRINALLVAADAVFSRQRAQLITLAARQAVPAIYALPEFVTAGGLVSYGASRVDAFRLVGVNTGKILKGARPADLPVEQSVKVELAINLKTAKALDLAVPLTLLARADQVIE